MEGVKDSNLLQGRQTIPMMKPQEVANCFLDVSTQDYLHQEEVYDEKWLFWIKLRGGFFRYSTHV